ncbi:hypothetical protein SAY87_026090 [Trapa incisa]|uniref:B-like cyclin n=1 Tax=Trapa incisa TaxID=236973 RepID=A0AAN7JKV0_9MYRT|nr:hypothetical protein SAY87_026090 [Trapa incisa]
MNSKNGTETKEEIPAVRITRARAKTLGMSSGIVQHSRPAVKQVQNHGSFINAKRAASDKNKVSATGAVSPRRKRRAVLEDVTNIPCDNILVNRASAVKCQNDKHNREGPAKKDNEVTLEEGNKAVLVKELSKIRVEESLEINDLPGNKNDENIEKTLYSSSVNVGDSHHTVYSFEDPGKCMHSGKFGARDCSRIEDIDSKIKDPQACIAYAADIYKNAHILELEQRPSSNYMETLQQDITPNMRGILIDWLVEVSQEYMLAADTLYLTVNLIDRFLSLNHIEKQRLQLLGVTCMLIASKYEEICAPRVEEFCIITDSTYTKEEVLKMENEVLNLLHFRFSIPTIKPFLRRFIRAAQNSYKETSVELEYLANYLAELTLLEYNFLKFLPSIIAASAVFLARWTLHPLDHPWNPTLEHYTNYKARELKTTVLAMEHLQLNTSACTLNAIRVKYRQQWCKRVSTLTPKEPAASLFKD